MATDSKSGVESSDVSGSGSTEAGGRAGAGDVTADLKDAERAGVFAAAPSEQKLGPAEIAAGALVAVGGLNWGLVALGKFDLVAALTGNEFGETNLASRLVYGAVGAAAAAQAVRLVQKAAG